MSNENWITCSIRRPLIGAVQKFVANRKDPHITNYSQFVNLAVSEKLKRDGGGDVSC
ncbi:MAG: hypothetical protein J4F28_08495 [Nitrosopumilaceae archaeon]|nr:hypothetical protein [Nitrosopumilaceae archaeon]